MKKYEILVILRPNLEKSALEKALKDFEKKFGGEIVQKEDWGLKKLAYPIKKHLEGYYVLYYIKTEGNNISEMRKHLNISKDIVRGLILSHDIKFPFEMKTTKDLVFPERTKPDFKNKKFDPSKKREFKDKDGKEHKHPRHKKVEENKDA